MGGFFNPLVGVFLSHIPKGIWVLACDNVPKSGFVSLSQRFKHFKLPLLIAEPAKQKNYRYYFYSLMSEELSSRL